MNLVEPVQIFLIFPKIIELGLFLVIALQENYKYKDIAWKNRSLIHRFFIVGATGWIVFLILDIIVFLLASISFTPTTPEGIYMGYNVSYPSLFVANVLRDISTAGFTVLMFSNLYISLHMEVGEERVKKYLKFPYLGTFILISVILVAFEKVAVTKKSDGIIVDAVWSGLGAFSMIVALILYFFFIARLRTFIYKSRENISPNYYKQLITINRGLAFIGYGLLFFFIAGVLKEFYPEFFSTRTVRFIVQFIGHGLWTLSPIFIYHGIKVPLEIINPTLRDYRHIGVKELYSRAQDSLMAYFIVLDNEFIYSSRLIANIFEIPYEELMTWDLQTYINRIVENDRKKFTSFLSKSENNNILATSGTSIKEIFYRIKVKKQVRWVRQITSVYRSYGKLVIQAAITDYTHQYMLSSKLYESQAEFQSIIDNMSDMIVKLDVNGNIININPAFTRELGYQPFEIVGTPLNRYLDDKGNITLSNIIKQIKDNQYLKISEYIVFENKNGEPKSFLCTPNLIFSKNDQPIIQLLARNV